MCFVMVQMCFVMVQMFWDGPKLFGYGSISKLSSETFLVLSKSFGPDQNVLNMNFYEIFSYSASENEK